MTTKLRVGVIYGGRSGEHEVSLRSARSVIEALDKDKYEVIPLGITRAGQWLAGETAKNLLPEAARKVLPENIADTAPALATLNPANAEEKRLDAVIPVLHGTYGEDGTIQGLFEMAGVPYVGCGVLASACGMDKVTMKVLFKDAGLPICRHTWFLRRDWEANREAFLDKVAADIGFPCFVKPANLGSSVGISKAKDRVSLAAAIDLAARYDRKIIIEEGLDAREIECAVMGNDDPQASLPGEYVVYDQENAFLDYTEKYAGTGHNEFVIPSPISTEMTARIQEMAARAFKAVDGAGLARVDFFLTRGTGELFINEINTMPGLTDVSGWPKMWAASGWPLARALDNLIELALERHAEKARNEVGLIV
jgi:D-alanine-D-alanine ligase